MSIKALYPLLRSSWITPTTTLSKCCSSTASTQMTSSDTQSGPSERVKKVMSRRNFRFVFPEFLPDPDPSFRNNLAEFLIRKDALQRREKVDIPEFYVGSVIRVTMSDPNSANDTKTTTFNGIVINRGGTGLRAWAIVRNVVDGQGMEIMYRLYSPNIISIETLKLERRLDEELYYLRDAPEEFSTFPLDMEPDLLPEGQPVPLNDVVVKLGPMPWARRWEMYTDRLKGYTYDYKDLRPYIKKFLENDKLFNNRGWQNETFKYDLMRTYRRTIPVEEQDAIWEEVGDALEKKDKQMKRAAVKRALTRNDKFQK